MYFSGTKNVQQIMVMGLMVYISIKGEYFVTLLRFAQITETCIEEEMLTMKNVSN